MAGIARGKIMPAEKFAEDGGMRLPESVFLQTVTGDYPPDTGDAMSPAEIDIILKADQKTVRRVPWAAEPTAQVIHDCFYSDGRRVSMAPRHVLRDRKSTRLNSSHTVISYAVFCLKKKKKINIKH